MRGSAGELAAVAVGGATPAARGAGDAAAFRELADAFRGELEAHCCRYLRDPHTPIAHVYGLMVLTLRGGRVANITGFPDTSVFAHLHQHNILDAGDRYLAIDPKPMLGEPEFDVPPFVWNPVDEGHAISRERTERRLAAFAPPGLTKSGCGRGA
jgi:Aminoglycoside/hydroxyurea antibiotic resistance kinase